MLLTQNDYNKIKDWLKKNSEYIKDTENPYGHDDTSKKIVEIIKDVFYKGVNLKKPFYDLEVK